MDMSPEVFSVAEPTQAGEVRRAAGRLAERLGFDAVGAGRASIVATELATNLAKHTARGGQILLQPVSRAGGHGLELLALDTGPGMNDPSLCERDGFSTQSSPGTGLGAIRRQSSVFDLWTQPGTGTVIRALLWAGSPPTPLFGPPCCRHGVVSVPVAGEDVSGDGWDLHQDTERAVALVVDGLGHGPLAHEAARLAIETFRRNTSLAPAPLLDRLHDALRPTRGAAAAVAEIFPFRGILNYAGVGNISSAVIAGSGSRSLVSLSGIVGHQVRRIQQFAFPWTEDSLLVMHSDGISTHWNLDRYPGLTTKAPALVAGVLFRDNLRGRDDATVLVLGDARGQPR